MEGNMAYVNVNWPTYRVSEVYKWSYKGLAWDHNVLSYRKINIEDYQNGKEAGRVK